MLLCNSSYNKNLCYNSTFSGAWQFMNDLIAKFFHKGTLYNEIFLIAHKNGTSHMTGAIVSLNKINKNLSFIPYLSSDP